MDTHGRLTYLVDDNFGTRETMPTEMLLDVLEKEVPKAVKKAQLFDDLLEAIGLTEAYENGHNIIEAAEKEWRDLGEEIARLRELLHEDEEAALIDAQTDKDVAALKAAAKDLDKVDADIETIKTDPEAVKKVRHLAQSWDRVQSAMRSMPDHWKNQQYRDAMTTMSGAVVGIRLSDIRELHLEKESRETKKVNDDLLLLNKTLAALTRANENAYAEIDRKRQELKDLKEIYVEDLKRTNDFLNDLVEVVIWMSGCADFGAEGQAGATWKSWAQPRLHSVMEYLKAQGSFRT